MNLCHSWRELPSTRGTAGAQGAQLSAQDKVSPDVRHISHQQRADLVRNGAQAFVIPLPRVRRAAGDYQLGPKIQRLLLKLVVVDQASLCAYLSSSGAADE